MLFGHKWYTDCTYRFFGQAVGEWDPGTVYELKCNRSDKWVIVDRARFMDYYDQYCQSEDVCPECGEIHE